MTLKRIVWDRVEVHDHNTYEVVMPKAYEKMRDKFKKTMPAKAAKTKAAKIFNAKRKAGTRPVTRGSK